MIKKIICHVVLYSSLINSMQENPEYKAPLKYLFINIITLICPDEQKQQDSVKETIRTQSFLSQARLGALSLTQDLRTEVKEDLFNRLEKIELPEKLDYIHTTDLYIDDKRKAPAIFCAYCVKSEKDGQEIYDYIKNTFKKPSISTQTSLTKDIKNTSSQTSPTKESSWWSYVPDSVKNLVSDFSEEKNVLLLEGLDVMFNDKRRNTVLGLCSKMLNILQNKDENIKIIVTANMSHACCFELLKLNNLHEFFKDVHASDTAGCITAHKDFYGSFLKKQNIKPEECFVIDEHAENLLGAQSLGMTTLHKYKNDTFHEQLKMIIAAKKISENK